MPLFSPSESDNRLLNEFFLYVLEDFHTCQSLGELKFTSDDPEFIKEAVERVYLAIPATATTPELPATRAFSRELVAYIAAFLPVATYYKASDSRTGGLCDNQYTVTLETLTKTPDEKFSAYLVRKIQGWFRRWATPRPNVTPAAAAAAASGGGGSVAATPGRSDALVYTASSDEEETEAGGTQAERTSPSLQMETMAPGPAPAAGKAA